MLRGINLAGGTSRTTKNFHPFGSNATFFDSHSIDASNKSCYNMDLTPLIQDPTLDITDYTLGYIDRFRADVESKLKRML